MSSSVLPTSRITLKLLIDSNNGRVLLAEAGKDFVDFLFTLVELPSGSFSQLLETHTMGVCLGNLYESIRKLCPSYSEMGKKMDSESKPTLSLNETPPLLPDNETSSQRLSLRKLNALCKSCFTEMSSRPGDSNVRCSSSDSMLFVQSNSAKGGSEKKVVSYMVMDNLEVASMPISIISLLKKYNIQETGSLEERVVEFGMTEALKLLKASLEKKEVLTRVFLRKEA